jgi:hypothetical protein
MDGFHGPIIDDRAGRLLRIALTWTQTRLIARKLVGSAGSHGSSFSQASNFPKGPAFKRA